MEKKIEPKINTLLDVQNVQNNIDDNIDFKKIYESLLRRKKLLLLSASLIFTLGVLTTINQRIRNPIFRGTFSLLISDPISTKSVSDKSNSFSSSLINQQTIDISTLIEVLKSPSVLSDVASKYKLSSKALADSIDINSVFNKSGKAKGILKISIDSNDPKKLKNILNDVSNSFINASIMERQKKLIDGISFLSTQEPLLKKEVNFIQNELLNLRKKHKFILPDENTKKTEQIKARLAKAKMIFKEDSNLVLSLEEKLEKDFELKPEVQKEYDEILLRFEYALSSLESLTRAKEGFQLSLTQSTVPWKIIVPPSVRSTPVKPSLPLNFATYLVAGILIGSILALIRERFDNVFHNDEEVKKSFNVPILGTIPYFSALQDVRGTNKNVLKIMEDSFPRNSKDKEENIKNKKYESFIVQDAFRNFFTNVRFIEDKKKTHSILLTSSLPSEGKSLLNIILAKTIADLGLNVLLIDCDLRKPQIHQRLGMNNLKGFSDLFFDKNYLWTNAIKPVKNYKNWDVITSGSKVIDPIRILSSDKLQNLMNDISTENKYDFIIYDSPPALAFSDSIYLSKHTDGVLLAISLNNVSKNIPQKVIDRLNSSGIDILGLVTNQIKFTSFVDESNSDYYNDYYNTDDDTDNDEGSLDLESNSNLLFKVGLYKEKISNFLNNFFNWIDR